MQLSSQMLGFRAEVTIVAILETTEDISQETKQNLEASLRGLVTFEDQRITHLRSTEPPSWLKVFADVAEWISPLKVIATVFFSQLAKNAADDLWKNKARIAVLLRETAALPLRKFAEALSEAKRGSQANTDIVVGLPIPDDHFGTALIVPTETIEDAAAALAVFVCHAEEIDATVRAAIEGGEGPASSVRILLRPNGQVLLRWQHQKTLEIVEHEFE